MPQGTERLSRVLRWVLLAGAVAWPVLTVAVFMNLEWALQALGPASLLPAGADAEAIGPVTAATRWLGLGVAAVPTALTSAMLLTLSALFGGYARGEVFTHASVHRIRRVGLLLLVRELLAPLTGAAMTMVLTMNNPPGQRMASVGLDDSNVTLVVTALMLMVAARVMDRARELHEDAVLTI